MSTLNNLELIMRAQSLLSTYDNLVDTITQLLAEDASLQDIKKALQYLTTRYTSKEISECCKTFVSAKTVVQGKRNAFHDYLVEGERTEQQAYDYIVKQGLTEKSANVLTHMTSSLSRWSLGDRIRGNSGIITLGGITRKKALQMIDNPESYMPKESEHDMLVRMAYENLEAELAKAKPNKAKMHPDSVSSLNDDALTKAYSDAFKAHNKGKRQNKSA